MYCILVMTTVGAALGKCHNASVNEGFEDWRRFVMEWKPKLRTRCVGLLMNVLGYRFRDDIPNRLAAFERTVHDYENQSTKTVDDDVKIGVTMLGMKDASERAPHHRQSIDATAARSESEELRQGRRQQGQRQGRSSAKASARMQRTDRPRKQRTTIIYCNKSGHVKAECRKKQKDFADAEERPLAASPHPNDTAAVVPLQCSLPDERHTSTFAIAMPRANSETSCESSSEQAVRSPGAGSIAPAETQQARPIAAIPSNETYLMMDTCAGASIFPRGCDQSATDDSTVAPVRLSMATDGMRERNRVLF